MFVDDIKTPDFVDQVKTDGVKSTFREGVVYRHPGMAPLLQVSGDHYQMGLQYGVLLRPEIIRGMKAFQRMLEWQAEGMGVPCSDFSMALKTQTEQIAGRLPDRFQKEIQGMADGSGVPRATVVAVSLIYDASEGAACTGVLLRGKDGAIIHGRNNDTSSIGGKETGNMFVIVKRRAKGYNVVTQMDYPLWGGVETGYNDRGLTFSEETLTVREPNPGGFSLTYLVRMALEECATFEELYALFDRYPVIGAYGCVWGQIKQGRGLVAELTPTAWKAKEMDGPLMWNFNHLYDSELRGQQHPRTNLSHANWNRETIAETFAQKTEYTVQHAIEFLRLQKGPGGIDFSWHGLRHPICNLGTQEMVVFDPKGDGFYFASGTYHAARKEVYHIHDDFSRPPDLFMEAVPLDSLVEQVAAIENRLESRAKKLDAFVELADQHKKDAHIQFIVALNAFQQSRLDLLNRYAKKAFSLEPEIAEHRLYAGMAALMDKNSDEAISLLEAIDPKQLYPNQELYRLSILESVWAAENPRVSSKYAALKTDILQEHDAQLYFESEMLPLVTALGARR